MLDVLGRTSPSSSCNYRPVNSRLLQRRPQVHTFRSSRKLVASSWPRCRSGCAQRRPLRWSPRRSMTAHPASDATASRFHWDSRSAGGQRRWTLVLRSWRGCDRGVVVGACRSLRRSRDRDLGNSAPPPRSSRLRNLSETSSSAPSDWWHPPPDTIRLSIPTLAGVLAAGLAFTGCAHLLQAHAMAIHFCPEASPNRILFGVCTAARSTEAMLSAPSSPDCPHVDPSPDRGEYITLGARLPLSCS
jgi:hypothetical protein